MHYVSVCQKTSHYKTSHSKDGVITYLHRRGIRFVFDLASQFFQNAITPEIMVGIAPYLEQRRTLGAPSIFYNLTLV